MHSWLSEEFGIRYTVGGFTTWFISWQNNIDLTQVIGFVGLVLGLVIQIASFKRNRKLEKLQDESDKRAREADARDKLQHDLQMQILQRQLSEGNK